MRHPPIVFLFVVCISVTAIISCCKKNTCLICPSPTDTTSHNFVFQQFVFGESGGSILYDVAIINDTLVYAVGEVYLKDSTGKGDPQPYNLAKWDGQVWKLHKVPYIYQGQAFYNPIQCIFAFGSDDIWIAGNGVQHWDGARYNEIDLSISLWGQNKIKKIWGINNSNIYIVGDGGSVAFYNGSTWAKIESGTTLSINDIYGAYNSTTRQWEILAVASDDVSKKLMRIQGTSVYPVPDDSLSNSLYGVWFVPCEKYYVVGAGIGFKTALDNSPWYVYPSGVVTSYMSGGVRGNNINDVFVAGSFFEIVHFNGSTWRNYRDVIPFANGAVGHIAVKGNLIITVGLSGQNAVAIIGQRQ